MKNYINFCDDLILNCIQRRAKEIKNILHEFKVKLLLDARICTQNNFSYADDSVESATCYAFSIYIRFAYNMPYKKLYYYSI
jgi:hypothetical protein